MFTSIPHVKGLLELSETTTGIWGFLDTVVVAMIIVICKWDSLLENIAKINQLNKRCCRIAIKMFILPSICITVKSAQLETQEMLNRHQQPTSSF